MNKRLIRRRCGGMVGKTDVSKKERREGKYELEVELI